MALYDTLGRTYSATRQADPRVAAQIGQALADSGSVVNIGAGAGSYESAKTIAAIEPSQIMIEQRPPGAAQRSGQKLSMCRCATTAPTRRWRY